MSKVKNIVFAHLKKLQKELDKYKWQDKKTSELMTEVIELIEKESEKKKV